MPDLGLEMFANWQAVVFALMTYVVTYTARTVIQTLWRGWRESRLYTELFLHIAPMLNGLIIALLARNFPWPDEIARSLSARVMFGTVLGMFCGIFYGRVRALLTGRKMDAQGNSIRPPGGTSNDGVMEVTPSMMPPTGFTPSMMPPPDNEETTIKPFPKPSDVKNLKGK